MIKATSFKDLLQEGKKPQEKFVNPYLEFQRLLHERVCNILMTTAEEELISRKNLLNILFNDLTCQLDQKLTEKIGLNRSLRYYEVLNEFYELRSDNASELETIGMEILWDDVQFQIISGLLLYRWVFCHGNKRKFLNNFIKTAIKLFFLDVEHSTRRFQPVYDYTINLLLSNHSSSALHPILLEIFNLSSKFYFYYHQKEVTPSLLIDFLKRTQITLSENRDRLEMPKGHCKIQTLNMFVNEVVRLLMAIHNESTIVLYLERCTLFSGPLTIPGTKTRIHLQSVLLDYTTPGTPYYPTRKIREQAQSTIDIVFPTGKITRLATNWMFRILSPVELAKSWWFWIVNWITAFFLLLSHMFFFKY